METYPSIDTRIISTPIYAFDKLDGSNIRAEWTRKNGFQKFGTRRRLLEQNEPVFGEAVTLIQETQADELDRIFRKERYEKATAFFEFHGPNSFAGHHEDEAHQVDLIEVHRYKQGILTPKEFMKSFSQRVQTAELLYQGNANQDFVEQVRNGTLEGMTFEGVVCKGGLDNRNRVIMFKVKNQSWLSRLKNYCGADEKLYEAMK